MIREFDGDWVVYLSKEYCEFIDYLKKQRDQESKSKCNGEEKQKQNPLNEEDAHGKCMISCNREETTLIVFKGQLLLLLGCFLHDCWDMLLWSLRSYDLQECMKMFIFSISMKIWWTKFMRLGKSTEIKWDLSLVWKLVPLIFSLWFSSNDM